jgi:hypothetical protein
MCNLLMISTSTCHAKMHIILVFNPYMIHRYDLHILVHIYMDFQLDDEWIKVKENPFIYIIRWVLERGTHLINVVYELKRS